MKKSKIISTFIYCRDGDLAKITRRILDSLKENTQFKNPVPALAEVEQALLYFIVALSDAGGLDRVKVSIKDDKKAILKQMLTELAYYVTQTCKGDKTLLLSSGFDINAEKGNPQKAPPKLQVDLGISGQITTRVNRVTKARAYVHQYTADPLSPQSVWISETTLKPAHTFTGLASGAKVWLRVIVIDRYGDSIYWDPVLRIVQ
jgi:hypothetical protein